MLPKPDKHELYPFLLVNIGSGVSILKITGEAQYERVSGTSLGGGTFLGLCRALSKLRTFDEAMDASVEGDSNEVDMTVGDIYGTSGYEQFQLKPDTVASSFGKAGARRPPHPPRDADLARSLLLTSSPSARCSSGELSKAQRGAFKRVQKSLKTALVRQLAPESVQQLKAKRIKVVMMFALQLVKFWLAAEDKKATEADVRAVVAAVQAVDSKSPVVKGMVKQVSDAAGIPVAASNGAKADKKTPTEDEDELMPEHDEQEEDAQKAKAKKTKGKSKSKSPKDKQKKKRKRAAAEE
ncbi:hypothetical protein ON010_g15213 [Phytophthora cinnamomi]|nr:hypothetical protein ON010_g15213 [Phytophthora cinnamomi]